MPFLSESSVHFRSANNTIKGAFFALLRIASGFSMRIPREDRQDRNETRCCVVEPFAGVDDSAIRLRTLSYAASEISPKTATTTTSTATTAATCFSVNPSSRLKVSPKSRVKRLPELECSTNIISHSGSGASEESRRSEAITVLPWCASLLLYTGSRTACTGNGACNRRICLAFRGANAHQFEVVWLVWFSRGDFGQVALRGCYRSLF